MMKILIFLLLFLINNLFSSDFELEIMSATDGSNTTIFNFSDNTTYRHFHSFQIGKTY